jgi:hypothetical protein
MSSKEISFGLFSHLGCVAVIFSIGAVWLVSKTKMNKSKVVCIGLEK